MINPTLSTVGDPASASAVMALEADPFYQSITQDFDADLIRRRAALADYFSLSIDEGRKCGRCVHLDDGARVPRTRVGSKTGAQVRYKLSPPSIGRLIGLLSAWLPVAMLPVLVWAFIPSSASGSESTFLPAEIRLVNYYPAANGWTYMWDRFDADTIDRDFGRIASLKFNTVRICVLVSAFKLPIPSDAYLGRLAQVIEMAGRHGLKVQLTLFDWLADFTAVDASQRWVDTVLAPYKNDPRIVFIDVHNELDTTVREQLTWAQRLVPHVRSVAGSIPVTVSVTAQSGRTIAAHLQTLISAGVVLDLADVHVYGNAASAYSKLQRVVQVASPLPVFVGETGYSSYAGFQPNSTGSLLFGVPPNTTATEAMEAYELRTISHAVSKLKLPMIAPWSYADFTAKAIPPSHVGSNPLEYHFGLLRTDYTDKPAAEFIRQLDPGVAPSKDFNNGFEQSDDSGLPLLWRLYARPCGSFTPPGCGYQAQFARDTNVSRSGRASGRISGGVSNGAGTPAFYLSPPTPVLPGHVYTASAFAKGNNVSGSARVNISWYTESACFMGSSVSTSLPTGTSQWTRLSVTATLPSASNPSVCSGALPSYVELRLESGAPSPSGGGTVWFDDVRFTESD